MADEYHVGQVLYVIPAEKALVVPVCILEKRTSEKIEGVETTYVVKSPKPDSAPVDLKTVKGSIYTSVDEVRTVMFTNSRRAIEDMIARAQTAAEKSFGIKNGKTQQPPPAPPQDDPLGDDPLGLDEQPARQEQRQIAPPQQQSAHQAHPPVPQNGNGHNERKITPDIDENGMVEVKQPDGSIKKVKLAAN